MSLQNRYRIIILQKWAVFLASILSFCGISVGFFGCTAYGPPDDYFTKQLNDMKEEVLYLEKRINILNNEKSNLDKSLSRKNFEVNNLSAERDSLIILLKENEK